MSGTVSEIRPEDRRAFAEVDHLLEREGLTRDGNLDYTCVVRDEDDRVIATGSCFCSTLRCIAVDRAHQGEGLLNRIMTHLLKVQFDRGNRRLFLYTKCESAGFFADLGFYEIARVKDALVFMENRRTGFSDYLDALKKTASGGRSGALVINANPFTLGHQYLAELAAGACDTLHLFVVSEDASLFPFAVRKRLVEEGVAHLKNVVCHDSGAYIISSATFPGYFLKDEAAVVAAQAGLDLAIFVKIAAVLGVTVRYVGQEPYSSVTDIYNGIMARELPKSGIACEIVPRREANGVPISASAARECLKRSDFDTLRTLVPETTLRYLLSPEAAPVLEKIRSAKTVRHD